MLHYTKALVIAVGSLLAVSSASQAQVTYIYGSVPVNLTKATSALMAGDLEQASKYYKRAVKMNLSAERLAPALGNLCDVEFKLSNLESAEKYCSRAIGEDRRNWRAYVNRGHVRLSQDNREAAYADYQTAAKIRPEEVIIKNALAYFEVTEQPLLAAAP